MLTTGSSAPIRMPPSTSRLRVLPDRGRLGMEQPSLRLVLAAALGVGVVSFFATELMHYWLVPDLGRHHERLLAEALSALIVSCLIAKLAYLTRQRHLLTVARMQVIAEMNHHIRNALTPISLSADATENQQLVRVISDGVDASTGLFEKYCPAKYRSEKSSGIGSDIFKQGGANTNEQHKSSLR